MKEETWTEAGAKRKRVRVNVTRELLIVKNREGEGKKDVDTMAKVRRGLLPLLMLGFTNFIISCDSIQPTPVQPTTVKILHTTQFIPPDDVHFCALLIHKHSNFIL